MKLASSSNNFWSVDSSFLALYLEVDSSYKLRGITPSFWSSSTFLRGVSLLLLATDMILLHLNLLDIIVTSTVLQFELRGSVEE